MAAETGQIAVIDFSSDIPKILTSVTAREGDDEQQKSLVSAISVNDKGDRLVLAIGSECLLLNLRGDHLDRSEIDAGQEFSSEAYLSGDGRRLMVLTEAGVVLTWRLPGQNEQETKLDQARRVPSEEFLTHAALSKDGRLVLAATDDGSLILFDISNSSPPVTLAELLGKINSVSLSMDSRFALVTTADGAVRILDVATPHKPAIRLSGSSAIPLTAQLDRGNRNLMTTYEDGIGVKSPVYMDDEGFKAQVVHGLTRCLSQAQRRTFGLVASEQESLDSRTIENSVPAPDASDHCPG